LPTPATSVLPIIKPRMSPEDLWLSAPRDDNGFPDVGPADGGEPFKYWNTAEANDNTEIPNLYREFPAARYIGSTVNSCSSQLLGAPPPQTSTRSLIPCSPQCHPSTLLSPKFKIKPNYPKHSLEYKDSLKTSSHQHGRVNNLKNRSLLFQLYRILGCGRTIRSMIPRRRSSQRKRIHTHTRHLGRLQRVDHGRG